MNRYAASTFDTCLHQALYCMAGPSIEIHVDSSARPVACHSPASIPLHWLKKVCQDSLGDKALSILEKFPYDEPTQRCHSIVITGKHDGTPRRTNDDLSPLNKFCKRETFASETPIQLASRIPGRTWKTVTDACNGYHSVSLRKSNSHLTTFIAPFGRWRYNEPCKNVCHLAMGTLEALMLFWQSLSKRNVALTRLSCTTRSWKISISAPSNTLLLPDGPASFSTPTNFNSLIKLWILPNLDFLSRLLSHFQVY